MPSIATRLKIPALVIIIDSFLMTSCRSAKVTDLPGRYFAKTDWGESTLTLQPNHTMEQEVRVANRQPDRISGTWNFDKDFLTLKPCLAVKWKVPGERVAACIDGVVLTPLVGVEISIDSQYGLAYKKIASRPVPATP